MHPSIYQSFHLSVTNSDGGLRPFLITMDRWIAVTLTERVGKKNRDKYDQLEFLELEMGGSYTLFSILTEFTHRKMFVHVNKYLKKEKVF